MDENSANKHQDKRLEDRLRFAGEKIPSMKRRSEDHDYHSKHFYMITLVVKERYALLGRLVGNAEATVGSEDAPHVVLSTLGQQVYDEWMGISKHYKEVAVIACQMMPDHLHGILYVREDTDYHLGQVIKGFKLGCNRILRAALETQRTREGKSEVETQRTREGKSDVETQRTREGKSEVETQRTREGKTEVETQRTREGKGLHEQTDEDAAFAQLLLSYTANTSQSIGKETLWEAKYNDKILHNYSSLQKWKDYLADNPRRLAIRRAHPDLFRVRFGYKAAGREYAAIGNRFLLDRPEKIRVQLSRSLTDKDIENEVVRFLNYARQGIILISPAISDAEKAVMRAVLNEGLPLVFLTPWGFNSFSKPGHQYYEACAEGRFLILAPWEHQNERVNLTRAMCLELNEMAQELADS